MKTAKSLGGVGILTEKDLAELSAGTGRVARLMAGGMWHSADEIRCAAGNGSPATEGLRRLRELREIEGVEIERRRTVDTRLWSYRIARLGLEPEPPKQLGLFA